MLKGLRERMNELSENYTEEIVGIKKDTETIKKKKTNQSEMKRTISEMSKYIRRNQQQTR